MMRRLGLIVAIAVIGAAIYLGWAAARVAWGFALDDAWIHQTYARNFAATGQFAYVPGQPSSGSTSPLWTLLIALGYRFKVDYEWWTYAMGVICLTVTALGVWQLSLRLFPEHRRAALAAGTFCALEWHLVWAAVSGMETVLFTAIAVWLLVTTLPSPAAQSSPPSRRDSARSLPSIGLCSLLILTRPEGLLLVGLIALAQVAQEGWTRPPAWANLLRTLGGTFVLLAPALVFNWRTSGTPFPNTFYAKQLEYASVLATLSLPQRFAQVFSVPFVGAQVLLLPGLVTAVWLFVSRLWRGEAVWIYLTPLVWTVAHLATYALRLPVTYQHGRYEMPVIPVLIAFSVGGTAAFLRWNDQRFWPRVLSRAAALAMAVTLLGFVAIGARAYATDVAIIQGEMVRVARWLDANAAPTDLIAAHDIGAIGYFSQRPLLDLAGLISPEVIPYIRDQARLEALIRERGAAYLVTFPSWYPRLVSQPEFVPCFAGNAESPDHLTVYQVR